MKIGLRDRYLSIDTHTTLDRHENTKIQSAPLAIDRDVFIKHIHARALLPSNGSEGR
jgi:hypothetical protein